MVPSDREKRWNLWMQRLTRSSQPGFMDARSRLMAGHSDLNPKHRERKGRRDLESAADGVH
ncbi:hypothetical protein EYF80_000822 [Liparis tanakae]|uniref:Uncharacterized protein n=1 Tax=Liparis tanakae TaxID=230148 RepID=A0A4Z2JGS0_9TELE|nr:hypothetical protein EYF80_000822 [Liparis tanakae]